MLVDNLVLTVKDEDGVIINRHFNDVYIKIDSKKMMIANKKKTIAVYEVENLEWVTAKEHSNHAPRN